MENNESKKTFLQKLTGESRTETKFVWAWAFACLLLAMISNVRAVGVPGMFSDFVRDGATHSALLFGIWAKLSEIRHRFLPETRND